MINDTVIAHAVEKSRKITKKKKITKIFVWSVSRSRVLEKNLAHLPSKKKKSIKIKIMFFNLLSAKPLSEKSIFRLHKF